jgi:hypothetical protein
MEKQSSTTKAQIVIALSAPAGPSARLPQSSSDEHLLTSAVEMSQNDQKEFIVNEEEHDRMNRLGEVSLLEELEETKTSLDALLPQFRKSDQKPQSREVPGPDAPIRVLIVRGLCYRIRRKDLFCPCPKSKAGIKSVPALLAHLGKKHELADVHCKDFMRHFIHGLSPK